MSSTNVIREKNSKVIPASTCKQASQSTVSIEHQVANCAQSVYFVSIGLLFYTIILVPILHLAMDKL